MDILERIDEHHRGGGVPCHKSCKSIVIDCASEIEALRNDVKIMRRVVFAVTKLNPRGRSKQEREIILRANKVIGK